jgi:glycosyltransferase involved in cell wall biosynthesis
MKKYGLLICQNAMPEILRCIESIHFCDEIYVCDGGSTDGTYEYLKSVKDIYKLKLFERAFDNMLNQRNFLLEKIPSGNWIINIDQDESVSLSVYELFEMYVSRIPSDVYESAKNEKRVVCLEVPFYNLIHDKKHYIDPLMLYRSKLFYKEDGVHFVKIKGTESGYHVGPAYDESMGSQYESFSPDGFAIFHHAWFNVLRMEERRKRLSTLGKDAKNELEGWFMHQENVKEMSNDII